MVLDFFRVSSPSAVLLPEEKQDKTYRKLRFQAFLSGTCGYALYYVCRLSMGVMKQPLIDAGLLSAAQLGIIGACLYWAYALGKLVNGFLCDSANIKRFMAFGLLVSATMNFLMGVLGATSSTIGFSNTMLFVSFAVLWAINGWSQSMGASPAIIGLSRWYPLKKRGTYYGFFSASHNLGEGLSFIFVGSLVAAAGWKWGFFGASAAGALGILIILLFMHDTPESKGLRPIEVMTGEMTQEEYDKTASERLASAKNEAEAKRMETKRMQRAVLKNPGVWILAISSAFMYMSRYAINEWGVIFLQKAKDFNLAEAAAIIGVNPIFGILGTVFSGWLSDKVFKGNRKYPAFVAGILEVGALVLFLFGGPERWVNILAMILFGLAIGVLIAFVGGLMAIDLVPRQATGATLGIVGMASYAAAGLQNIITGFLLGKHTTEIYDAAGQVVDKVYDFTYISWFWIGAAAIACLLPILNWNRKKQEILFTR